MSTAGGIGGSVVSEWADARVMRSNQSGGRLSRSSANALNFGVYSGEVIEIQNDIVVIGAGGFTVLNTDPTIDTDGTATGNPPDPDTFYGVFLSNTLSPTPGLLRLCEGTVGDRFTSNGQFYLGAGGDGPNWRLVGAVQTNSAGEFVDTDTQRFVANADNRIPRRLLATPGYVNDNAQTNVARANAAFGPCNGGTGDRVEFVTIDDVTRVLFTMHVPVVTGAAGVSQWGIGLDSTTTAAVAAIAAAAAANVMVSCAIVGEFDDPLVHAVHMLSQTGAGGATYAADTARNGSSADPIGAHLIGWVWM